MKIHWAERDIELLPLPLKVTVKQVILAGIRLAGDSLPRNPEVCITFVSESEMKGLNMRFRNKDTPTDVLAFPAPAEISGVLGDIVICTHFAAAQAEELGHSFEREIAFLTAHGLLHLLGYKHENPGDEAEMIRIQEEILTKAGIPR